MTDMGMDQLTSASCRLLELTLCVTGKAEVHTNKPAIAPLLSILGKFWPKLDATLDKQGVSKLEPSTVARIVQVTSCL